MPFRLWRPILLLCNHGPRQPQCQGGLQSSLLSSAFFPFFFVPLALSARFLKKQTSALPLGESGEVLPCSGLSSTAGQSGGVGRHGLNMGNSSALQAERETQVMAPASGVCGAPSSVKSSDTIAYNLCHSNSALLFGVGAVTDL